MPEEYLEIRGARVHNLKNVSLRLPHNQLIVVTGVSGSGKSSLAFHVVFAEGRRRYVESLSSYARQFLERLDRPDADEILGISPTVAIRQKNTTKNPRSTVATATEIHDYLRLLFGRVGRMYCTQCGQRVVSDTVDAVTGEVLALEPGSRWYVLFPARTWDPASGGGASRNGSGRDDPGLKARLAQLRERGFTRLYQRGRTFEFATPESLLDIDFDQPVYVLADRLVIAPDMRERVADTVEIAYSECGEILFERFGQASARHRFSSKFECRDCQKEYRRPEPHLFSSSSGAGHCRHCQGKGQLFTPLPERVVTGPRRSLREGAIGVWEQDKNRKYRDRMLKAARRAKIPVDVPFHRLSDAQQRFIKEGDGHYGGIRGYLDDLERKRGKGFNGARLAGFSRFGPCRHCGGTGHSHEVLNIRVGGRSIGQVMALSLRAALEFFEQLDLAGADAAIAADLLVEIRNRLRFLNDVGLEYLTLNRLAKSLSGGEAQRIQLASSLGSRLVGVCYVLDEPSIGLHSRDTAKLIGILRELRDLGNTVLVVEHDRETMEAADHLVDLGPGGGERGGRLLFSGSFAGILSRADSVTGRYLAGREAIPVPAKRRSVDTEKVIRIERATRHNLKGIDVELPVGVVTAITGVSGSGKSTLLREVVFPALRRIRYAIYGPKFSVPSEVECDGVAGHELIRDIVMIDQAVLEGTRRSVPVTYIKAFAEIRYIFSDTGAARRRGIGGQHFSFNLSSGTCRACNGLGTQTIDMQFLADVELPCEDCDGKRFRPEVLEVEYRGKSIWDVLQLTVSEALEFFADSPGIVKRLAVLKRVGLGYIRLGQPTKQLSGGEAQRLKLALHIADAQTANAMFLFDEPTTGLHFDDIKKLLATFDALIENESTVVVIEHNLDVIKSADWVIDLGPEGGEAGGYIVAQGTPEEVARCRESHTARYLREVLP